MHMSDQECRRMSSMRIKGSTGCRLQASWRENRTGLISYAIRSQLEGDKMVEFFSGMNVIDILLCCMATAAFCVAVVCIIELYFYFKREGKGDCNGKKS